MCSCSWPCRFRAHRRRWRATVTLNPRFLSFTPLPAPLPPPSPAPSWVSTENNANAKPLAWGASAAAALRPGAPQPKAQNPGADGRHYTPRVSERGGGRSGSGPFLVALSLYVWVWRGRGSGSVSSEPPMRRWASGGQSCAVGDLELERPTGELAGQRVRFAGLLRPLAGSQSVVQPSSSLPRPSAGLSPRRPPKTIPGHLFSFWGPPIGASQALGWPGRCWVGGREPRSPGLEVRMGHCNN